VIKKRKYWQGIVFAADPEGWGSRCQINNVATIQGIECLFQNILRVFTTIAGLTFGLMLIIGGFKLIFSGGDQKGVQSAKNTLTYAFLGLILTLLAWFILRLIHEFTGVKVTEFSIPGGS